MKIVQGKLRTYTGDITDIQWTIAKEQDNKCNYLMLENGNFIFLGVFIIFLSYFFIGQNLLESYTTKKLKYCLEDQKKWFNPKKGLE